MTQLLISTSPVTHASFLQWRRWIFFLKTCCLMELFMKHKTNVPIPTARRSSCGTVRAHLLSRCCSSPQTPALPQDVFAGALQTELHSTSHLRCSAVSEEKKKIHPQPKLFARQNVKSGHVRYFQRAPGKQTQHAGKVSRLYMCKLIRVICLYRIGNEGIGLGPSI